MCLCEMKDVHWRWGPLSLNATHDEVGNAFRQLFISRWLASSQIIHCIFFMGSNWVDNAKDWKLLPMIISWERKRYWLDYFADSWSYWLIFFHFHKKLISKQHSNHSFRSFSETPWPLIADIVEGTAQSRSLFNLQLPFLVSCCCFLSMKAIFWLYLPTISSSLQKLQHAFKNVWTVPRGLVEWDAMEFA